VKKLIALTLLVFAVSLLGVPAFADEEKGKGNEMWKNVQSAGEHVSAGPDAMMDSIHTEMAKAQGTGEQLTGFVAGGAIGVRKTLHRAGAGVIDLLTFWIPKKQPLIAPEKAS
jgi:hypothetical protein